ncbi:hypothetical protein HCH_06758 [Hahella chejuensis KCTC 2396]|uniref:Uncharacterized protein n=1 Tax=Hahella chejuensis (strain KCTC 2396) TaxID=349521 RepID=Q2S7J2_HAHCH|nr:hypothetical protein HCH_06758 [Hahella chejuensis KCTC 2396]
MSTPSFEATSINRDFSPQKKLTFYIHISLAFL